MSAFAIIWKSETDDGRTCTSSSRQSRTSVSPAGRAVERIVISGWVAVGGTISRLYSKPLPSFEPPYHASFPREYVHELPSPCCHVDPPATNRPLAAACRVASAGWTK